MDINLLIEDYSLIDSRSTGELREIVNRYPWFTLARYLLARSVLAEDPAAYSGYMDSLATRLAINPYPLILLPDEYLPDDVSVEMAGYEAIDEFLDGPAVRMIPIEDMMHYEDEDDISLDSVSEDQELVSETLAEIYLRQGYADKAADIYCKLSLKYPEKSAYFANLIDSIRANKTLSEF